MRRISRLAVIAGVCLLGVPAVASADNLAVQVGGEVKNKPWIDLQGIYPKMPVVHVGDTIDFSVVGFHTIAVEPNGTDVLPLIVPTGGKFPVTPDAAGNPFWWGGVVDAIGLNGAVFAPTGTDFDGTALVHSAGPAPLSVTFTKAGTFVLACEIHRFMRGAVKVVDPNVEVRRFAKQEKKGRHQLRKDARRAKHLDRKLARKHGHHGGRARSHGGHGHHNKVATNATVRTGAGTPRFSLLRFYPMDTTVKVGGTVTWKWTGFNEVHTVTFLKQPDLDALAANLLTGPTIDPVGGLPTEQPGTPVVHTADVHGNGLLGAGIIPDPAGAAPNTFMAQFNSPGVFTYRCLIHAGMTGTVTVKA